eukprot:Clim_evm54s235 gene=Clim_evmTU54s235
MLGVEARVKELDTQIMTDNLPKGFFSEISPLWPGQSFSLEVEEVLYHKRSKFQDVLVLKTKTYGNCLVLDGVIQATERDEFAYQEMMAYVPLNSHPSPKRVLLIGAGDGGVMREVVKHPGVENVTLCEIDEDVVTVSKKYLPYMAAGFQSPKATVKIGDGFQFMKENTGQFDVIITDSSDPIGPANVLFEEAYYELMKKALAPGGIICAQGECQWLHLDLIKKMQDFCKKHYPVVDYAYLTIPTYPSGQIGMILCSLNPETDFQKPLRVMTEEEVEKDNLRYYNAEIHSAAFILPQFAHKRLRIDGPEETEESG